MGAAGLCRAVKRAAHINQTRAWECAIGAIAEAMHNFLSAGGRDAENRSVAGEELSTRIGGAVECTAYVEQARLRGPAVGAAAEAINDPIGRRRRRVASWYGERADRLHVILTLRQAKGKGGASNEHPRCSPEAKRKLSQNPHVRTRNLRDLILRHFTKRSRPCRYREASHLF